MIKLDANVKLQKVILAASVVATASFRINECSNNRDAGMTTRYSLNLWSEANLHLMLCAPRLQRTGILDMEVNSTGISRSRYN